MDSNSTPNNRDIDQNEELARLRDRLSFYESFDQLIQENITRAGDLLREAAAKKGESDLALRTNNAEVAKQQLAERVTYRKIFSSLLDEVTTVQQNVERLARQVADALDDLEAVIPAQGELAGFEDGEFPSMPTFSSSAAGELGSGSPSAGYDEESGSGLIADPADVQLGEPDELADLEPVDEVVTVDEAVMDTTDFGTQPTVSTYGSPGFQEVVQISVDRVSGELSPNDADEGIDGSGGISVDLSAEDGSWNVESIESASHPDAGTDDVGEGDESEETSAANVVENGGSDASHDSDDGASDEGDGDQGQVDSGYGIAAEAVDESADDDNEEWADGGGEAATTLLVHGVPRATTALSLKRYLEGLAQVHAVEPREYAEGVLRLQVSSDRPVGIDDLLGWPEAAGMEQVDVREDFLEVRLGQ